MIRVVTALCTAVVALLATASTAHAETLDDTVEALKASPVYVAPGTEGTTPDTAGELLHQIHEGDYVFIIMLPQQAISESGEEPADLTAFAQRIDEALGGKNIIGLSVGDQIVAYSAILPAGEATDLMDRAISVSTNQSETLITFIRNVHHWQDRNPEAAASKSAKPEDEPPLVPLAVGCVAVVLAAIATIVVFTKSSRSEDSGPAFHAPRKVSDILRDILQLAPQVNRSDMEQLITQIVWDCDAYFERQVPLGTTVNEDSDNFKNHLGNLRGLIIKYIDVQDCPRYYDNPRELMESGENAMRGFAEMVLDDIRDGNTSSLAVYLVNADIMNAERTWSK